MGMSEKGVDAHCGTYGCNLMDTLVSHAAEMQHKPFAIILAEGSIKQFSYGDVLFETRRWAQLLSFNRVGFGDCVFICVKHRHELYFAFLGAMWVGAVPTVIPYPTPKQDGMVYWAEYESMLARMEPRAIVTYAENIAPLRAALAGQPCRLIDVDAAEVASFKDLASSLPVATDPSGVALLQFSSGTTGLRKGVVLSHAQIAAHMQAYTKALDFGEMDIVASWLPLYHDMGLINCFLLPLHAGATIISIDAFEWVAKPWCLLEAMETYRATFTWLPNFAFHHIVRTLPQNQMFRLAGVRAFIDCSEPCRPETLEQFATVMRDHGVRREQLQACYGMAETVLAVSQTPLGQSPRTLAVDRRLLETKRRVQIVDALQPYSWRLVSCGRPVGDLNVRIACSEHADVASDDLVENVVGEIEVRGVHVFSGYFRNDTATRTAFNKGWYRTGDMGFINDGELFVCGRKKEMLIVHGRNYYVHDIEAIVSDVEHVKPGRVVVFGVDDQNTGSEQAIVLLETELSGAGEQRMLCRAVKSAVFDRLELTVKSVRIVQAGALIKTTSGKMSRAQNKVRYLAERSAGL